MPAAREMWQRTERPKVRPHESDDLPQRTLVLGAFTAADAPDPDLLALEPDDVHLVLDLDDQGRTRDGAGGR